MLRDVNDTDSYLYRTSGITKSKDSKWNPKPSWYYLRTMSECLRGMSFESEMQSSNSDVMIYKFVNTGSSDNPADVAYAIWLSSSEGAVVHNYKFEVEANNSLTVNLNTNNEHQPSFTINGSKTIDITVTERPVFVLAGEAKIQPERFTTREKKPIQLSSHMISYHFDSLNNNKKFLPSTGLIDEQLETGNPYYGMGEKTNSNWDTNNIKDYPYSAIIDLGNTIKISSVCLFDANSHGLLSISIGTPNNWKIIAEDHLYRFNKWNTHVINSTTRFIKVTKHSPTSNIGEIIVYTD